MKYILMMNCPKTGYETFGAWPRQDLQAHIAFMMKLAKDLRESGELVSAEGLSFPDQAKLVRAGNKPNGHEYSSQVKPHRRGNTLDPDI